MKIELAVRVNPPHIAVAFSMLYPAGTKDMKIHRDEGSNNLIDILRTTEEEVQEFGNRSLQEEQYFSAVFDSGYLGCLMVPYSREVLLRPS